MPQIGKSLEMGNRLAKAGAVGWEEMGNAAGHRFPFQCDKNVLKLYHDGNIILNIVKAITLYILNEWLVCRMNCLNNT